MQEGNDVCRSRVSVGLPVFGHRSIISFKIRKLLPIKNIQSTFDIIYLKLKTVKMISLVYALISQISFLYICDEVNQIIDALKEWYEEIIDRPSELNQTSFILETPSKMC